MAQLGGKGGYLPPWPKISINWAAKLPSSCKNLPPSITEI